MKNQLARLFGETSAPARMETATPVQWRKVLRRVLRELDAYLAVNVQTDGVHLLMLHSGLAAASEALRRRNFWPAYAEGITRLALLLMGDYPDHRKRRFGRHRLSHYQLSQHREVRFFQSYAQKLHTLMIAPRMGIQLKTPPGRALMEFHEKFGRKADPVTFFAWYRQAHPEDYAAVF